MQVSLQRPHKSRIATFLDVWTHGIILFLVVLGAFGFEADGADGEDSAQARTFLVLVGIGLGVLLPSSLRSMRLSIDAFHT